MFGSRLVIFNGHSLNLFGAPASLDLNFLATGPSYVAEVTNGNYLFWDNEPASLFNAGRYQTATFPGATASNTAFNTFCSFTRNSPAWAWGPDGTLTRYENDQPRFEFDPVTLQPLGLLIEDGITNYVKNPAGYGAVIGTTTLPANWTVDSTYATNGITATVAGSGTLQNGLPYVDIRFSGTSTSASVLSGKMSYDASTAGATGQNWSMSCFVGVTAGSMANVAGCFLAIYERNSANGFLQQTNGPSLLGLTPASGLTRQTTSATLSNANTAYTQTSFNFNVAALGTVDITFRFSAPQFENLPAVTSPVLNAPGVTNAYPIRSREYFTIPFGSWMNKAAFSVVFEGMIKGSFTNGQYRILTELCDIGTNRFQILRINNNGSGLQTTQAGTGTGSPVSSPNSVPFMVPFRAVASYTGTSVTNMLNAGPATTGAMTSPPNTYQIFVGDTSSGGGRSLNGYVRRIQIFPRVLSAQEMVNATEWSVDLISASGALDPTISVSRVGVGSYFDKYGVLRYAYDNTPRIDYDPATLVYKGLLIEEARTNYILNSYRNMFTANSQAWTSAGSGSFRDSAILSPDGSNNAVELYSTITTANNTNVYGYSNNAITKSASAQQWTGSIFIYPTRTNPANTMWFKLTVTDTTTGGTGFAYMSLNAAPVLGTISTNGLFSNTTANLVSIGNGWYRLSVTTTTDTGTNMRLLTQLTNANFAGGYPANNSDYCTIWGPQLEPGAFATSFIPTGNTIVARNGDLIKANCFNQPYWTPYYANGFSFVSQMDSASFAGTPTPLMVDDGNSSNNAVQVALLTTGALRILSQNNAAGFVTGTTTAYTANVGAALKIAGAFANNDSAVVMNNGSAIGPITTGTGLMPTAAALGVFTIGNWRSGSGNAINGHMKQLTIKGRRVANSELPGLVS